MDNYNVNRKVVNFKDFSGDTEKEELNKVKRSTKPNSEDQQHIGNSRYKFNKVTRKMDDLSPDIIDDKIEAIEELDENVHNYMSYSAFDFKKLSKEYIKTKDFSKEEKSIINDFANYLNKKKKNK